MKTPNIKNIRKILNTHDPISLIALGAPKDEYNGEAREIAKLMDDDVSAETLEVRVRKMFIRQFDEGIVGSYDFKPLVDDIVKSVKK